MYQIWHKNSLIIDFNGEVIDKNKIPWGLRHYKNLNLSDISIWINNRVNNLHRTYMNYLYIHKRIGRSTAGVIADSGGISITDMYWIQIKESSHTWDSLQILRDEIWGYVTIGLDGKIDKTSSTSHPTSNFALKGVHPKSIYKGYILKKGNFAEREYVGSKIAEILNIPSQTVQKQDEDIFALKVFTNDKLSLVHAYEYLFTPDRCVFKLHLDICKKFKNAIG